MNIHVQFVRRNHQITSSSLKLIHSGNRAALNNSIYFMNYHINIVPLKIAKWVEINPAANSLRLQLKRIITRSSIRNSFQFPKSIVGRTDRNYLWAISEPTVSLTLHLRGRKLFELPLGVPSTLKSCRMSRVKTICTTTLPMSYPSTFRESRKKRKTKKKPSCVFLMCA